ncbi:MAG: multidrug effflux MFS transporter, partial [Ghiorsea sp.]|nr:multidrug effflux MFS transporter [Ghiorsea sp.]
MPKQNNANTMAFGEFIALMAVMMSLMALSIDIMLPALGQIGHDMQLGQINDTQLLISLLFLGFAIGMIFYGPFSDSYGRKPAIYIGLTIAILGGALSWVATDYNTMLWGRFFQGLGLASVRIVTMSLVRDLYRGDEMGKVMSLIMSIFILVPILAPSLGQVILMFAHWRTIFAFILGLSILVLIWFTLRQQETIHKEDRHPLSITRLMHDVSFMFQNKIVLGYTIMSGLVFAAFLGYLNSSQQLLQEMYHLGKLFPLYFGLLAIAVGCASVVNAKWVMRFGMRTMSKYALQGMVLASIIFWFVAQHAEGVPALWQLMAYLAIVLFC